MIWNYYQRLLCLIKKYGGVNMLDEQLLYTLRIRKAWFRQKPVFTQYIRYYEELLKTRTQVNLSLNAGNIIYTMLKRLQVCDWEKQNALVESYRDLVYRMSYVTVKLRQDDYSYFHVMGEQSDVLWALSFLTQVYPDETMDCYVISTEKDMFDLDTDASFYFQVRNGKYIGKTAQEAISINAPMPNIWRNVMNKDRSDFMQNNSLHYDFRVIPASKELCALPDGRCTYYMRMDDRFHCADKHQLHTSLMMRHLISASLIKDFKDMVNKQQDIDYGLYQMRYTAYMNKVHELEALIGGLEVSVYDILPIGERGLPYASNETIVRTNYMDCHSISYAIDRLLHIPNLSKSDKLSIIRQASQSIIFRIEGYATEYQTYQRTSTSEPVCQQIYEQYVSALYRDVARLEYISNIRLSKNAYRVLCNDSLQNQCVCLDKNYWQKQVFGDGYCTYLQQQLRLGQKSELTMVCLKKAWSCLKRYYLDER